MSSIRNIFCLAVISAGSLVAGSCSHKNNDGEVRQTIAVDVAYPVVDSVTLHKTYPGYIESSDMVDVVGRVNGTLLSKDYADGQIVTKGQVLFTIESTQYRDAVSKAEAALKSAKAAYDYAVKQHEALKKAYESDAVSRMEVVQAESNMNEAKANIQTAEAALSQARTDLGYCTVRAPLTGQITSAVFSPGAYIGGGGSPVRLASIYASTQVDVLFSIEDEQYIRMLNDRTSPKVKIDYEHVPVSFGDSLPHSYTANLMYMSPTVDKSTGTVKFKGIIDNPYGELKNGMYAKISLPYGFEKNAIIVNESSIGTDQRGKYMYVVNDSNKVVYTPIVVGEVVNDSMRVVTKGLTPKSRYVTKALLKVRDGMTVKPVVKR